MERQVIRIGPRGGRIVAEGSGGKGPQYEGHSGGGGGYGLPQRPSQGDLFAGQPRTLALTAPEPTQRRRSGGAEQGSLFGPVATAPPRPAAALPSWAKPREPSPAVAKLTAQAAERKPPEELRKPPSGNAVVDGLRARAKAFSAIGKGPEIRPPESYKTAADAIEAYEAHNKHAAAMRELEGVDHRDDLYDAKNRDAKVHGDHAHELYRRVVELQSEEDTPTPTPAARLEAQVAERKPEAPKPPVATADPDAEVNAAKRDMHKAEGEVERWAGEYQRARKRKADPRVIAQLEAGLDKAKSERDRHVDRFKAAMRRQSVGGKE